ncbi:proteasome regulatory particle base subunit [Pelomyxa schiedti]|nr:proteasome regulatory particle base subunit [Pelomyxa schiedti]
MDSTTVTNVLALLDPSEPAEIRVAALSRLNDLVDEFWFEVADQIAAIEVMYEDPTFEKRDLAALVASKVYYHLDEYRSAMQYALGAGGLLNIDDTTSEFVTTIITKCIDEYTRLRQEQERTTDVVMIDDRLVSVVEKVFQRCLKQRDFKLAIGIALDSRRLDTVEEAIKLSEGHMLNYCRKLALADQPLTDNWVHPTRTSAASQTSRATHSSSHTLSIIDTTSTRILLPRPFRSDLFRLLVKLYNEQPQPDYPALCQCLIHLGDTQAVAALLLKLLDQPDKNSVLLAYQIAFDICESSPQSVLNTLKELLCVKEVPTVETPKPAEATATQTTTAPTPAQTTPTLPKTNLEKLLSIISGEISINLYLDFLYRHNNTDLLILSNIKNSLDKSSVLHSATVFANALMNSGTTSDTFLRDNLEWLSKATNWAKFSATAGLGVIHKGHLKEARKLLSPYLPQTAGGPDQGSPYSEGGALYALGLIHANHGASILEYLLGALKGAANKEIVLHGCCLGLGLAAMASENEGVYDELRTILYMMVDSAVSGEAAGLAMGLVMLGSGSAKAISEMIAYAHDTQHERIIRGLAIGMALVVFGRQEEADTLIEQLLLDKDAILRYGGMYAIALAYCGTGSARAIKRLLHEAVSDVSDDVRRAAVTGLGFVLCRQPQQCPHVVSLLTDSYNPHVRYGATLALGIACAGSALSEAVDLLEPMTKDPVDFVRQGAMISLALVLMQTSKQLEPRVETICKLYDSKVTEKGEELLSKMGAILSTGIINAGGRNTTVSLLSPTGPVNFIAAVGLAIFCQHWYWFPYVHFLSLSLMPTTIIGLDADLNIVPSFKYKSDVPPPMFAYPAKVKPPEKVQHTKGTTSTLSYNRNKPQAKKAQPADKKDDKATAMEVDDTKSTGKPAPATQTNSTPNVAPTSTPTPTPAPASTAAAAPQSATSKEAADPTKPKEVEPEKAVPPPPFEILENASRVTQLQRKYIVFSQNAEYTPVKNENAYGIVILQKSTTAASTTAPEAATTPADVPAPGAPLSMFPPENPPTSTQPPTPFEWNE